MPIFLNDGTEAQIPQDIDRVKREFGIPEIECLGCWLGDAGPEMHDLSYGCEYGPYAHC